MAEPGRLDRILAEQKASGDYSGEPRCFIGDGCLGQHDLDVHLALDEANIRLAGPQIEICAEVFGVRRLRAMAVALESECAALADALDAVTHDPVWRTRGFLAQDFCTGPGTPGNDCCGRGSDHPVHRTPARVRSELEG